MGRKLTWFERQSRERRKESERASRRIKREQEIRVRRAHREKEKAAEKRAKEKETRNQEREWEDQVKAFDNGMDVVNNPFLLVRVSRNGKRIQRLRVEFQYTTPPEPQLELPQLKLPNPPPAFRFVETRELAEKKRKTQQTLDEYYTERGFKPTKPKSMHMFIVAAALSAAVTLVLLTSGAELVLTIMLLFATALLAFAAISGLLGARATEQMGEEYTKAIEATRTVYQELLNIEKLRQDQKHKESLEVHRVRVEEAQRKHAEAEQRVREKHEVALQRYKESVAQQQERYKCDEVQRLRTVEQALTGNPAAMALMLEARFPLRFDVKPSEDLEFSAEDLNDHEIAYSVVSTEDVELVLDVPSFDFLPDQGIKLSPNKKKLSYYDITDKEKERYYANYLCGTSLVYCAAVAELLPTVRTIRIETDTLVRNPGSGKKESATVLQALIDVAKLKKLAYKNLEPKEALENFQATWAPPWSSKGVTITRSINREGLAYATEDNEGADIAPHFRQIFDGVFGDTTDKEED